MTDHPTRSTDSPAAAVTAHGMRPPLRAILVTVLAIGSLLFVSLLLFQAPILGRADNGDQYRVLDDIGLRAQSATAFTEVRTRFSCAAPHSVPASTASVLGLLLARPACVVADELPVQLFGALYLAIHGLGLLLFLIGLSRTYGVAGFLLSATALIAQTTSPYYVSFFNSFFEEAATISLATLLLGLAAYRAAYSPRRSVEVLSAMVLLGLAFTKVVHVIFLPLLRWTRCPRMLMIVFGVGVCIVIAGQAHKASHFQTANAFNRVFLGLLVVTPEKAVAPTLRSLGLEDLQRYVGKGYWPEGARELDETDRQRVAQSAGLVRITGLYLARPTVAVEALTTLARRTASASAEISYLAMSNAGSWAQASEPASVSTWTESSFRTLARHAGAIALLSWIALVSIAIRLREGYLLTFSAVLGAYPFIVLLGDGFYEFEKHLLPFCYLSPLAMLLAFQSLALRTPRPTFS